MSVINIKGIQTAQTPTITKGKCGTNDDATCPTGTIIIGSGNCTTGERNTCLESNINSCLTFTGGGPKSVSFTNTNPGKKTSYPIECQYNYDPDTKNLLQTSDDFNSYYNAYNVYNKNDGSSDYYKPLMDYCLENTSENCNISTFDGTVPPQCPRILTYTQQGNLCKQMYLNEMSDSSVKLMESKMQTYCQNPENIHSPACYCLAALVPGANQFSDIAQEVVDSNLPESGQPQCWLAPCRAPLSKTLNDILLTKDTITTPCPPPPCGAYANFYNDNSFNNVNIKQIVVCDGSNRPAIHFLNTKVFGLPIYVWLLLIIAIFIFILVMASKAKKKNNIT